MLRLLRIRRRDDGKSVKSFTFRTTEFGPNQYGRYFRFRPNAPWFTPEIHDTRFNDIEVFKQGTIMKCVAGKVINPSRFYVLRSELLEEFEVFKKHLNNYVENGVSSRGHAPGPGDHIFAWTTTDDDATSQMWHRAKVLNHHKKEDDGDRNAIMLGLIKVLLLDYGEIHYISSSEYKRIPWSLEMKFPLMAIECELDFKDKLLRPPAIGEDKDVNVFYNYKLELIRSSGKVIWPVELSTKMQDILKNKTLSVVFDDYWVPNPDSTGQYDSSPVPDIRWKVSVKVLSSPRDNARFVWKKGCIWDLINHRNLQSESLSEVFMDELSHVTSKIALGYGYDESDEEETNDCMVCPTSANV